MAKDYFLNLWHLLTSLERISTVKQLPNVWWGRCFSFFKLMTISFTFVFTGQETGGRWGWLWANKWYLWRSSDHSEEEISTFCWERKQPGTEAHNQTQLQSTHFSHVFHYCKNTFNKTFCFPKTVNKRLFSSNTHKISDSLLKTQTFKPKQLL